LPVIAVFGMYLLVHLVTRFVLGFSLVLWGVAFVSVRVPCGQTELARRAMLLGTLVFAASTIPGRLHDGVSPRKESVARDLVIAEAISYYGFTPRAAVASIGDRQVAYWAHLARVSVVAEVLVDRLRALLVRAAHRAAGSPLLDGRCRRERGDLAGRFGSSLPSRVDIAARTFRLHDFAALI
jgi:hypothetical protein